VTERDRERERDWPDDCWPCSDIYYSHCTFA